MIKTAFAALALAALTPISAASPLCAANAEGAGCCKTCKKGKACGDTCIAKNASCSKPKGCACNG